MSGTPQSDAAQPTSLVVPPEAKTIGTAYILLIFFGIIGVHKFYLGKTGMGILYIFTGGILSIGLLVDVFTLTGQVRDANRSRGLPTLVG